MKTKLINFANLLVGRTFVADVNFALAAIWDLSSGDVTVNIPRKNIEVLANAYQKQTIGFTTQKVSIWNDILKELADENLISITEDEIRITQLTVDLFHMAA